MKLSKRAISLEAAAKRELFRVRKLLNQKISLDGPLGVRLSGVVVLRDVAQALYTLHIVDGLLKELENERT
jgi:hypothetical protein